MMVMKRSLKSSTTRSFERALAATPRGKYVLRLYVAGATERSRRALDQARHLCDVELKGRCDLEVIDVYQQPILALEGQIVATPTLVKEFPLPVRRFIGALDNTARIVVGLDLKGRSAVRP
jgi:circadian clock protein KaiB